MKRQQHTPITGYLTAKLRSLECSRCSQRFVGEAKLNEHLLECNRWLCKVCSKVFHSEENFEKHLRNNCPPKRFPCGKCGRDYSRQSDTTVHEKSCLGKKPAQCEKCGVSFLTNNLLKTHNCDKDNPCSQSPLDDKPVATFVFFDLETTGLIEDRKIWKEKDSPPQVKRIFPQITQLCMIAVSADSLANIADNNTPRVLNKLQLTVSPTKLLTDSAVKITGMYSLGVGS